MILGLLLISLIAISLLSVLFYFLNKRLEKVMVQMADHEAKIETIMANCVTIRDNQTILLKDIKNIFHELKKVQKS